MALAMIPGGMKAWSMSHQPEATVKNADPWPLRDSNTVNPINQHLGPNLTADMMLFQYRGSQIPPEFSTVLDRMQSKVGVGNVIAYPQGFTPILVGTSRLEDVRKLLDNNIVVLSPEFGK